MQYAIDRRIGRTGEFAQAWRNALRITGLAVGVKWRHGGGTGVTSRGQIRRFGECGWRALGSGHGHWFLLGFVLGVWRYLVYSCQRLLNVR